MAQVLQQSDAKHIENLVISAVEGGSNYWIRRANILKRSAKTGLYNHCLEGEVEIVPDGEENKVVNRQVLEQGFEVFKQTYPKHWNDVINENEDANTADIYFQCCLFGKVVFG